MRRVSTNGGIKWHDRWVNVTRLLGAEYIGLEEVGDGLWQVDFGALKLGRFDERLMRIIDQDGTTSRNPRRPLPMSSD